MRLSIHTYACIPKGAKAPSSMPTPQIHKANRTSYTNNPPSYYIHTHTQIPVLHESWSWSAADAGPTGGIGPGAGAPGTVPTFTVPSQGDYITTWF